MDYNSSTNSVRAVSRAVAILKCFSPEHPELSLGEITELVGLAKSTIHRILATLEQEDFIEQDTASGKYRLSFGIMYLGMIVHENIDLQAIANRVMAKLSKQTNQTSNLYVLRNNQRLCIGQVAGTSYVRRHSYLGALLPLHFGAAGKVLLAYMPELQREDYYKTLNKNPTERWVDIEALKKEIVIIRQKGYCVTIGERDSLSASVAAPCFDYSNQVVGAVTVSGPASMFTPDNVDEYKGYLLKGAEEISRRLGYHSKWPYES